MYYEGIEDESIFNSKELDGACGEGSNGKKQVYDWKRYYEVIRRLQPNAVISISGPDIRWCGNEAGQVRPGWFYHQEEDDYDRVFRNEDSYQRFAKKKGAL